MPRRKSSLTDFFAREPSGTATYNVATGFLSLKFPGKPSRDVLSKVKRAGFRYRPSIKVWKGKWTAGREDVAKSLGLNLEKITKQVDYGKRASFMRGRATRARGRESEHRKVHDSILRMIPPGQPILVGHHSEKRHRRDLKRVDTKFKKMLEEGGKAEHYERRASHFEVLAESGESPVLIHRRIGRLEADVRRYKREGMKRQLKVAEERLAFEKKKYKKSGGIPADSMTLKKGDFIKTSHGYATVVKVNPKTVAVNFHTKSLEAMNPYKLKKTAIQKMDRSELVYFAKK